MCAGGGSRYEWPSSAGWTDQRGQTVRTGPPPPHFLQRGPLLVAARRAFVSLSAPMTDDGSPSPRSDSGSATRRRLRRAVALSFPVAFALHDLEEVLAADTWGRTAPDRIRDRFPGAPALLVRAVGVTTFQMAVAVGVVGVGVGVAAGSALRDLDGDLGLLPPALVAFAGHGATHLLATAAYGGYTPGVGTVPLVIAPYSLWAFRALRRAAAPAPSMGGRDGATAGAVALGLVVGGQALGRLLDRRRRPQLAS